MTNTLHRTGDRDDLKDDYILFAMCTRGKNDEDGPARLRRFLEICARHGPVNMGDGRYGGIERPSRRLNPLVHWRRPPSGSVRQVIEGVDAPTTVAAVFDDVEALRRAVEDVRAADLGLSVNIAALTDDAREVCRAVGLRPHAVEHSFGFLGRTDLLPDRDTLALTTMCGHGMVATAYAQKMIDWVKTGRRTPRECARSMARFCVCGVFNPVRAERTLVRLARRPQSSETRGR